MLSFHPAYLTDARLADSGFKTGTNCFVRPQDIQLGDGAAYPLKGIVVDVMRHGAVWRVHVRVQDAGPVVEVDMNVYDMPAVGTAVSLSLTRAHIFPA